MSIIYGKRIRLRAVEREDVQKFHEWVNDPEVTRSLALYLPMSMRDEENWFDGFGKRDPNEKPLAIEIRKGKAWKLIGNYPNPFNPETTISYSVKEPAPVKIEIYNTKGQLVRTLVNQIQPRGFYSEIWNGTDERGNPVASGVYMYRMTAGNYRSHKKMMLIK